MTSGHGHMPTTSTKRIHSTAGLLVGQGTALEIQGMAEIEFRQHLVSELKLQIELALVQRAGKAATAQHAQLIAERAVHTGLLPYDLWLAGNKKGARKGSNVKVGWLPVACVPSFTQVLISRRSLSSSGQRAATPNLL